ncbi:MAG: hypothetical protein Q8P21_02080, partial [bacterium]|nr:hypothetical protein [bacterium]
VQHDPFRPEFLELLHNLRTFAVKQVVDLACIHVITKRRSLIGCQLDQFDTAGEIEFVERKDDLSHFSLP